MVNILQRSVCVLKKKKKQSNSIENNHLQISYFGYSIKSEVNLPLNRHTCCKLNEQVVFFYI